MPWLRRALSGAEGDNADTWHMDQDQYVTLAEGCRSSRARGSGLFILACTTDMHACMHASLQLGGMRAEHTWQSILPFVERQHSSAIAIHASRLRAHDVIDYNEQLKSVPMCQIDCSRCTLRQPWIAQDQRLAAGGNLLGPC